MHTCIEVKGDESDWLLDKLKNDTQKEVIQKNAGSIKSEKIVMTSANSSKLAANEKQLNQFFNSSNSSLIVNDISSTNSKTLNRTEPMTEIDTNNDSNVEDNPDEGFQNNTSLLDTLLNKFDRQTLIMIVAFLIGVLLIGILIAISICICNGVQTCKTKKSNSNSLGKADIATNPAYDNVKYAPNFDSDADNFNQIEMNNETYPSNIPLLSSKVDKNKLTLNSTSSLSCSTASINSVVYNKTPNTIEIVKSPNAASNNLNKGNDTPSMTPMKGVNTSALNLRSSISNIVANTFNSTPSKSIKKNDEKSNDSENERSCLLDETDSTEVPNESVVRKPLFQSQAKTGQQILREQKLSNKNIMHPQYTRTQSHSESHNNEDARIPNTASNNRLSAASSRSSITMPGIPLDFDKIKDDIDDLAVNKEKLASRTNLQSPSQNASQIIEMDNQADSVNNSIADIYRKEFINIQQQSNQKDATKKLNKFEMSVSSSSIISETMKEALKKKRLSMNIDVSQVNFDTNGRSVTNLDKNASVSNYTVSSEKSCY